MRGFLKNIVTLVTFVVLFVVVQLLVGLLIAELSPNGLNDVGFMVGYFLSMFVLYLLATLKERLSYGRVTPINHSRRGFNPVVILSGVVLLVAVSVVLAPLSELFPGAEKNLPEGPLSLVTIVVLAPIFEELIFRGRLYNILHHNGSPLMAASLSALAFGVVHLDPLVCIEALVVGVMFSYFYIVRGSIATPIILHMCNNAMAYALVVLSYRDESLISLLGEGYIFAIAYVVSAAIVAMSVAIILRRMLVERRNERPVVVEDDEIDD